MNEEAFCIQRKPWKPFIPGSFGLRKMRSEKSGFIESQPNMPNKETSSHCLGATSPEVAEIKLF